MKAWLHHLQQSPYCYLNYPGLITLQGREACPCGWVGPTLKPVQPLKPYTIGQVIRMKLEGR